MENNKLIPFERNRYFVGKLLTSADFKAEQTYSNNKRRFVNSMMFGSGIVCGLSVYSLDDVSIMVESGVAIDELGREIVVENSVVKKLSTIEGFDALHDEHALLCLRYKEEPMHQVYTVNRQDSSEEYEYNRIRESWDLVVTDSQMLLEKVNIESEFLTRACLFCDDNYIVNVTFPSTVSCGSTVKMVVSVEKLSNEEKKFSLNCLFQTPSFCGETGLHELKVSMNDLNLIQGEKFNCEYWLTAQQQETEESVILLKSAGAQAKVGEEKKNLDSHFILKVALTSSSVEDLVTREIGKISLEMHGLSVPTAYIPLAELTLEITKNAYIIEKVRESGVKKYIPTFAEEQLRREYISYFSGPINTVVCGNNSLQEAGSIKDFSYQQPVFTTGVCEIPLDQKAHRGDVFYSDEIMHGLGKGNVFIQVGFEYLSNDPRLSETSKNIIYGDASLFGDVKQSLPMAQTAIKAMNDRGSFVVAAKLLEDTIYVVIVIRWTAIRIPSKDDKTMLQRVAGKSISALQPTVPLETRESHFFDVRFRNMEPCGLNYELTDKDSGEITSDGIYTAPAREGVYEIRISCSNMPMISTYAYAIVKKRNKDSDSDAQLKV